MQGTSKLAPDFGPLPIPIPSFTTRPEKLINTVENRHETSSAKRNLLANRSSNLKKTATNPHIT